MTPDDLTEQQPQSPIIESASGTTDPNNRHSGAGAYVIFAIAVALLALLLFSVTSCVNALGPLVASSYEEDVFGPYGSDELDWLDDEYEFMEDLEDLHHERLTWA